MKTTPRAIVVLLTTTMWFISLMAQSSFTIEFELKDFDIIEQENGEFLIQSKL